jgi:hypothetical protein
MAAAPGKPFVTTGRPPTLTGMSMSYPKSIFNPKHLVEAPQPSIN